MNTRSTIRCAIYTRKSTEEGLEQDFNSLHAQREACEAYIKSQRHEGWQALSAQYDDGGFSGGSMERPALKRLLADIVSRKVDIIVVYKVDRLTRSLADFAKMVETFDGHNVSFVSVTQQFNTTTSMGRLTLNVLLSFAQFEREVTGERIRDKITASKQKGMWMGGMPPPGYRVQHRKLVVHSREAAIVRRIFALYVKLKNTSALYRQLHREKVIRPKAITNSGYRYGGVHFSRGALRVLLSNPLYIGEVHHQGKRYPGQHKAIIEKSIWLKAQETLSLTTHHYKIGKNAAEPSLLAGLIQNASGNPFKTDHSIKGSKRHRYYYCQGNDLKPIRIPGHEIEQCVLTALISLLRDKPRFIRLFNLKRAEDLACVLVSGNNCSKILSDGIPHEKRDQLLRLLKRVIFRSKKLTIEMRGGAFSESKSTKIVSFDVPISIKQRGVQTRLIIEGDTLPSHRDSALIKTVARAVSWFDDITNGRVKDFSDLGRQEKLTRSVVGRICSLAFLEPKLVDEILSGTQPLKLRTRNLLREVSIPENWMEQRKLFSAE